MHRNSGVSANVTLAVLLALEIILLRFFSISAWNLKIGFGFLPVVLAAVLYGPVKAGLIGALGDLIGAVFFPIGAYFPGFTVTAFLTGLVLGFFLQKKQTISNIVMAVLLTQILGSLLMNTYWIALLYGTPFFVLLPVRILQTVIMIIVEIIVIQMFARLIVPKICR